MVKAVIFDMDGLMIDTETFNYQYFGGFYKERGYQLSKDDYYTCFTGRPIHQALDKVKEISHLEHTYEDFFSYLDAHIDERLNAVVPLKPGLIELLKYLKDNDYKIAMATSSGVDRVHQLFRTYDVLSYFDQIVCGPDVKNGKPAPDIFLKACDKLGIEPADALVLEDSEAGIEAGYCASCNVICIPDLKEPGEHYRNMLTQMVSSLSDVIDYLKCEEEL